MNHTQDHIQDHTQENIQKDLTLPYGFDIESPTADAHTIHEICV